MAIFSAERAKDLAARWVLSGLLAIAAIWLLERVPMLSLALICVAGANAARRWPARPETGLIRAASRATISAQRTGHRACALMFQLDDLQRLLQSLGVDGVTRLSRQVLTRLGSVSEKSLSFHIVSPGIFAAIMSPDGTITQESAVAVAIKIQSMTDRHFTVGGQNVSATFSVGLALSGAPDAASTSLIDNARRSLAYAVGKGPAGVWCLSDQQAERVAQLEKLARQIPSALKTGQIRAYFQPQISARTGAITGFEALARWQHPDRGLIPPAEFIPAFEHSGSMAELGQRVLEDSLDALLAWRREGLDVPRIGVNFSRTELSLPDLPEYLAHALDQRGLCPDTLSIEVLETVVAEGADDTVIRNLATLSHLGCRVDLDDFGTGHAAITTIRQFSVERIKIDRSFITGVDHDPEQRSMVAAILLMADRLGLETLAEGVETEAERAALTQLGCGHLQGFGIGRPMNSLDAAEWIRRYLHHPCSAHRTTCAG